MNVQETGLKGSEPSTEFPPGLCSRAHGLCPKRVLGPQSKEQNEADLLQLNGGEPCLLAHRPGSPRGRA